eukprot:1419238-Prymnesium_polylepis.1
MPLALRMAQLVRAELRECSANIMTRYDYTLHTCPMHTALSNVALNLTVPATFTAEVAGGSLAVSVPPRARRRPSPAHVLHFVNPSPQSQCRPIAS